MSIYNKLYSWQKNIVDKFSYKKSFGLFLDMGLGKTPLALSLAEVNNCTKVLIITLNSKANETEEESGSWLNWAKQSDISYTFKTKKDTEFNNNEPELLIVNYESLFERGKNKKQRVTIKHNLMNFIKSCENKNVAILIDESHKIKDLQSQQTLATIEIKKELKRKAINVYTYLLTGTPFTSGYIDLYAQLKILGCDLNKNQFIEEFCIRGNLPGLLGWQQPIVGYKNVDKLFDLIHLYAITIKSQEVVNLPNQIFINHVLPTTEDFKMFTREKVEIKELESYSYKRNIKFDLEKEKGKINNPFFRNINYPSDKWLSDTPGNLWLRARQLSIGFQGNAEENKWFNKDRLNQLEHFLETNENNYLLFYNYTPELIEIYNICEKLGYNIDVYCGEIKSLKFYNDYVNMKEEERLINHHNIILANFASGSTGMNWQEYNNCIIFSCPIYKDYEQGIKRIHRLGQKQTTFYHFFYQKNWLDEGMNKALQEKVDYSTDMFESDLKRIQNLIDKEGGEQS